MTPSKFGTPFPAEAKWAFTTRRVEPSDVRGLRHDLTQAISGDLVLGQVKMIGQHKRLQLAQGRFSELYLGDFVVAACGNRYAPDQFEAVAELDPEGSDLVAGGGVLGKMRKAHTRMSNPTRIKPVGLLTDSAGEVLNIDRYALTNRPASNGATVLLVVGTSMNAGKTTAAVSLAHGLSRAGLRVAGIKATGTGAFGDFNAFRDAGIGLVSDFTDAGMASTYLQPLERIERGFESLVANATSEGADVIVVELADGIFQKETSELLEKSRIRQAAAGVMFAAPDAVSAVGGVALLRGMGLEPFAVSGKFTCSPLAAAEGEARLQVPVLSQEQLLDPVQAHNLLNGLLPDGFAETRKVA